MRSLGAANMPLALDAEDVTLKRRGTTVGEWIKLDGDEQPLRGFVERDILQSGSEIRFEPFDFKFLLGTTGPRTLRTTD